MRALCHTLEDARTVVVQPLGKSSMLRVRLAPHLDATAQRALLRATAQRPVPVELELGDWRMAEGLFDCATLTATGPDAMPTT
eukprot:1951113-Rhodomonas_salina.2